MEPGHWIAIAGLALGGTGVAGALIFAGRVLQRVDALEGSIRELTRAILRLQERDVEVLQRLVAVEGGASGKPSA